MRGKHRRSFNGKRRLRFPFHKFRYATMTRLRIDSAANLMDKACLACDHPEKPVSVD
jgi:hypothetical protein